MTTLPPQLARTPAVQTEHGSSIERRSPIGTQERLHQQRSSIGKLEFSSPGGGGRGVRCSG